MSVTYRDAGVDIEAGEQFVKDIAPLVRSTQRPEVVGSLGGFSGLFALDPARYEDPLLVASTDGVGTKLKVANLVGKHSSIGIDLVAMCVNDIVVTGAEPLFFLDYFATAKLDPALGKEILTGIADGCRQAGCALLGGETAEMPGFYSPGDYDLAGFSVGVVERGNMLGSQRVRSGDVLLGLASSGLHSNGYSLARKVLVDPDPAALRTACEGLDGTLGDELLKPTRIYVRLALDLVKETPLHALAHITGGGLPGNLPRVLPGHLTAEIRRSSWDQPAIFDLIRRKGGVSEQEMLSTFNLGLGMVAVLNPAGLKAAREVASRHGVECFPIGRVIERQDPTKELVLLPTDNS
ncbi:MAG TPA: phosphoribosylformylglycinamidine cyclo-ligase [Myxococcota bacterium]|nr:phosphoribosylformylglycinamidine cyclo-ligase [Myxococcota bacterium]